MAFMAKRNTQTLEEFQTMIAEGRELIAKLGANDDAQICRSQILISYEGVRKLIARLEAKQL